MRPQSIFAFAITPALISAVPTTISYENELYHPDIHARGSELHSCYDSDIFVPFQWTGGSHSGEGIKTYCDTFYKDGYVITGIETWYGDSTIDGLKVYYSNGETSLVYGRHKGRGQKTSWNPSDRVELLSIYGNGKGEWVSRIKIRIKGGAETNHGKTEDETSSQTPSQNDIGTGILLGMQIAIDENEDSGIRRLGFMWLDDEIDRAVETDFQFEESLENLNSRKEGIKAVSFQDSYFTNKKSEGNSTFNFINQLEKHNTLTITATNQHQVTAGVKVEVEANVIFAKATTEFSLQYQYQRVDTTATETKDVALMRWEISNNVIPPGGAIHCTASAERGEFNGGYTSTIKMYLKNGKEFHIRSKGTIQSVGWATCYSSCEDFEGEVPMNSEVVNV